LASSLDVEENTMCRLCDEGQPQDHSGSRRDFLKATAASGVAAAGLNLFAARAAAADHGDPPEDHGRPGRRYVIHGGHVMSMDPSVGDFVEADVLVEGKKILAVGPNLRAGGAAVIDARGRIVMPGFVDTHHHQFETALRSFLADGLLFDDGKPHGDINYFEFILGKFAPVYRPWDVYINELFGSLSQIDAGVTTCHDISQIHHSQEHSNAAIKGSADSGRRIVFGYFESAGAVLGNEYPEDARRIKQQFFSSDDQLMTMTMGGEIYLPGFGKAWAMGRELKLQVVAHIVGSFGMGPTFDDLARANRFGPDNLFIHMTGMSDMSWQKVKDAGAGVSLAVPIEMIMRHGMPPILKTLAMGIPPSLGVDVECTLTADMFTQMRTAMALQRAFVNQMALEQNNPPHLPELLTTRDVLRFATMEGAKDLRLDRKIGSLTPGKEADIILLDAEAINVAPLNVVPGAVVSLMERSNVETVIVAGKVRKWKGRLLDVNLRKLRQELEDSRDFLFHAAGIPQDLFRPN
jgi:5-methylthioadenosine/S-adenosylhomocysteine deaminase